MAHWDLRCAETSKLPASEAFAGLDGVRVAVDLPTEAAATLGVEKGAISDRVDRQLRAAKIRNLSREESVRQGAAELCVSIRATQFNEPALIAYCVDVTLREPALLVRDRGQSIVAVTWRSPGIVAAGKSPLAESILRQIDKQVDYFVRGYRAANTVR
jgi:hypothetical protein